MSVWNSIVGQAQVVEQLKAIASGDPKAIAQSWLICGPPGSGRSNVARAFAAALESPGSWPPNDEPTKTTEQVLAGTHPDVSVLATNKVTIGIDEVRDIITTSEQMPGTAPWRIIIIEDVDRMMERTTNVLLKEIEEPSPHTIWLLCAPSAQDVLPTIRSRTHRQLGRTVQPGGGEILGIARFRAEYRGACGTIVGGAHRHREPVCQGRTHHDGPRRAHRRRARLASRVGCRAIGRQPHRQREGAGRSGSQRQSVRSGSRFPPHQRARTQRPHTPETAWRIQCDRQKDELKRRATRLTRDVLDRALNSVASIYRDVAVLQNNAEDAVGLINLENRSAITELSVRLDRTGAVRRLEDIATARRRLNGNGNPVLVFEALVLRADSVIFVISSNYRRFDSRFTGGTPRNPAQ